MTIEFKNQCVRDLAWAIFSPPLIEYPLQQCVWPGSKWYQQIFEETLPWLKKLDEDPSELETLLDSQKDRRLGKRFETLWYFWLINNPRYEVVEHNIQIIIDGDTLGEIDFIIYDKIYKKTLHWELAVKFYLGVGDTRKMQNWHGPNQLDRLDIKVNHLLDKQSAISREPRVRAWLKHKGLLIDECSVILKGRLYLPWSSRKEGFTDKDVWPEVCGDELLYSWWFEYSEFEQYLKENQGAAQQILPLIKNGWLERIPTGSVDNTYTENELYKTLSNKSIRLPLHVQLHNPDDSWCRAFVVDDRWLYKFS